MRADILALPLLFLAPLVSAGSGSHKVNKRAHRQHAARSLEQQRDLEIAQSNHNATLAKRQSFTGRGTYYITGLGACGINNGFNDYIVALNSAQYGGGYPGPQCFKTITIQANGVTVGGVQITDECPTCDWGGLDLSGSLFQRFASLDTGVIQLTWWFDGSNPQPQPTTTQQPAPTTTWTPPSSTWSPPASTWSPPPEPSTTWTPPSSSSAWVAPSSSTTTPPPPPSSSSSSTSSSASSSSYSSSASFNATANPFAVVSSYNGTASSTSTSLSASASASASSSATGGGNGAPALQVQGNNLEALNGLVTNYGQIIVVGAGGV